MVNEINAIKANLELRNKCAYAASPKHYPRPTDCKCNRGHDLIEVYNERMNRFDWDCPICIEMMAKVRRGY